MVTSWGMIPELLSQGKVRGHSVNCKTFEMHLTSFQMMDLRREKLERAAERKEDEHRGDNKLIVLPEQKEQPNFTLHQHKSL